MTSSHRIGLDGSLGPTVLDTDITRQGAKNLGSALSLMLMGDDALAMEQLKLIEVDDITKMYDILGSLMSKLMVCQSMAEVKGLIDELGAGDPVLALSRWAGELSTEEEAAGYDETADAANDAALPVLAESGEGEPH